MKIKVGQDGVEYDLAEMPKEALLSLKLQLDMEKDNIRDQIKRAEAHQRTTGEYADSDWYWSAVRARKHKSRQSQAIQQELSRRKKGRKEAAKHDFGQQFIDIARDELPAQVFSSILAKTQARIEALDLLESQREGKQDEQLD